MFQQQEKEWKDFREVAVPKGDDKGVNEHEIFCLWVLFQIELKAIDNITDYAKAIILAAGATEQSPDFDEDEEYVMYCLESLHNRGLISWNETMPLISQKPNEFIKGGLNYVH